jgi:hypothetical protein
MVDGLLFVVIGGVGGGSDDAFLFPIMHLKRVMSTYWDCDCILFTALILIGDKEMF